MGAGATGALVDFFVESDRVSAGPGFPRRIGSSETSPSRIAAQAPA